VAVAACALSALAGCSSGFGATSAQPYAPSDGILADSGDIRVLNALVVAGDGGRSGVLSMTVANRGTRDDRITAVSTPDATVRFDGPVELAAGEAVPFTGSGEASATLTGLTRLAGQTITVKLEFARTQPVTLRTVVVAAEGDYADITPAPSLTPAS
jgi:copper(I)-binding protein